ncbi:restriction endonuclease fold toxin 5 domain-containing protein [Mycobacterium sp. MYCO198283]|uniref:Tox-REase-5 domain-containing protein n=1 Tax=Mycobacterium sp. MYCO198283 TaxID=2883505 RepID=UPI001E2C1EB9|nr:Tox-REase-5 domain-containing protein [Mycobacterium sp. MYCO198283]MCG5430967.1 restriction endonuclease fold toxin 5 domain-containing protein [Mycobacterium sp. MYCO198283]
MIPDYSKNDLSSVQLSPDGHLLFGPGGSGQQAQAIGTLKNGARASSAVSDLAVHGPGAWGLVNESMSARAAAYQMQVTDHPITEDYIVNGVKIDGFGNGVLIDAKGYYSQFIDDGRWRSWFRGEQSLLDQAARQVAAAGGAPVQWTFAEKESANLVREMLMHDYPQIRVVWVPPQ